MKKVILGVVLGMAVPISPALAQGPERGLLQDVGHTIKASLGDARDAVSSRIQPVAYRPPINSSDPTVGVARVGVARVGMHYEARRAPSCAPAPSCGPEPNWAPAANCAPAPSCAPAADCGPSSCATDSCATTCSPCEPCCPEFWEHRSGVFGEFMYLSAGNVDFAYAQPIDGTTSTAVPVGPVAVIDPDYNPGFRVGGAWAVDSCSSFGATFSWFESHVTHEQSVPGGGPGTAGPYMQALTVHPNTIDVAADSLDASARYDIDFQMADFEYKGLLRGSANSSLNYVLGLRYAHLDQDFGARYNVNGQTDVTTDIDFDGVGPRFGLLGERLLCHGLLVYAKGYANFLVGDFNANYRQYNILDGVQAQSALEDDRIVSVLELELGFGWQNCCGNCRVTAGYLVQAWYNTMTTPAYINAVQNSSFNSVDETLTFDGLTVRAEYRF